MKLSRNENITLVDSSNVESTCITSTGGGKFGALECSNFTSTGNITASAGYFIDNQSVRLNYYENGTTTANLKAYGVSILDASTAAGTMKKYTLDAPIKGVFKDLVLASTVAPMGSSDATQVMTGSSNIDIISYNSTAIAVDYRTIAMQTPYTYAKLIGVSTSRWGLIDFKSASTNVAYNGLFGSTANGLAGLSSGLSTGIAST